MDLQDPPRSRPCLVTIGATAGFNSLISATLHPTFLAALRDAHYTELIIQYGKEGQAIFNGYLSRLSNTDFGVKITGYDFKEKGMMLHMAKIRDKGGVVISHAGSGSIMDALHVEATLIVVPNPALLNNHQVELAEALADMEYLVHGKLEDLSTALRDADRLQRRHKEWPPVNSGEPPAGHSGRNISYVMDQEMAWLD
ncbi:MAG: N-acetylglucosaminyldiphosphodolichol N-acetylglucosaminyltransferase catalytic subunit alg13 [Piccolia ochrophora]|nr:MAG: N-acetylglucosaminyldiphosphodolichol N-acetylglucosaminyltransferase catalytic subunit alg13 [Piccolia ochrophora]